VNINLRILWSSSGNGGISYEIAPKEAEEYCKYNVIFVCFVIDRTDFLVSSDWLVCRLVACHQFKIIEVPHANSERAGGGGWDISVGSGLHIRRGRRCYTYRAFTHGHCHTSAAYGDPDIYFNPRYGHYTYFSIRSHSCSHTYGYAYCNGHRHHLARRHANTHPYTDPFAHSHTQNGIAQLAVKEGTGEYRVSGLSNWLAASRNVSLAVGDSVRTPAASRASVTFSNGSVIVLEPGTEVQVQNYRVIREGETVRTRVARIALVRGKITGDVREDLVYLPSVFEIATASEVITIRGTLTQ
jgi:hypothetical protein